jgi:hypothetical protein
LAAVIIIARLDRGQADAKRPLQVEKAPAGQPVARRLDGRIINLPPNT